MGEPLFQQKNNNPLKVECATFPNSVGNNNLLMLVTYGLASVMLDKVMLMEWQNKLAVLGWHSETYGMIYKFKVTLIFLPCHADYTNLAKVPPSASKE